MEKKEIRIYTALVAIVLLAIIVIYVSKDNSLISKDEAVCIGQNSKLYVKLGCHFCSLQEEDFGKNYKYLNITDCYYDSWACRIANITGTPTWVINNTYYEGYKTPEKLKEITGCTNI